MDDDYRTRAIEAAWRAMSEGSPAYVVVDAVLALPRPYPPEVIEAAEQIRRVYAGGSETRPTRIVADFILGPPSPPLPEITDEQVRAFSKAAGCTIHGQDPCSYCRHSLIAAREVLSDGE
jgi:hypothetical protein